MEVKVRKLTDVELLREANSFTTGHDSHMSLATAYRLGHSPIRSQLFWIACKDIPRFVAQHFERHAIAVIPYGGGDDYPDVDYEKTGRIDRGAEDFRDVCAAISNEIQLNGCGSCHGDREVLDAIESLPERFDRYASTNLAMLCNAESLIKLSHTRLCAKASKETREVMDAICKEVKKCDPDLWNHLVPQCVRLGFCPEHKPCGYIYSPKGKHVRSMYLNLYNQ